MAGRLQSVGATRLTSLLLLEIPFSLVFTLFFSRANVVLYSGSGWARINEDMMKDGGYTYMMPTLYCAPCQMNIVVFELRQRYVMSMFSSVTTSYMQCPCFTTKTNAEWTHLHGYQIS
jgi:hypothetical protein